MNSGKHVLVAIPAMVVGGADSMALRISAHLGRQGYSYSFVTHVPWDRKISGDTTGKFRNVSPEVYHLDAFLEDPSRKDFLYYLLETRRTRIVHIVGSDLMYPLMSSIKKKYPAVRFVMQIFNEYNLPYALKYYDHADAIICDNEAIAGKIRENKPDEDRKVRVIGNGVDLAYFSSAVMEQAACAETDYGTGGSRFVVSYIGRLSEEKGPDRFLNIAECFRGSADIRFVLGGIGPMAEKCANLLKEKQLHDIVTMPGFVDIRKLLFKSHLVIVPSNLDGKPLIIMESMAMGVPVIASAVGGIPEMVQDGQTGFLCRTDSASEFAEKISVLMKDKTLRDTMAANCRTYAEGKYNINTSLQQYRMLFDSLAGEQAPARNRVTVRR